MSFFIKIYKIIKMCSSTVVSAGIFRIFGEEVAELPLVATSSECQGLVREHKFDEYIYYIIFILLI